MNFLSYDIRFLLSFSGFVLSIASLDVNLYQHGLNLNTSKFLNEYHDSINNQIPNNQQNTCNTECQDYCLSYFPTQGCLQTCGCTAPAQQASHLSLASSLGAFWSSDSQAEIEQDIQPVVLVTMTTTEADISNCISTCNLKCKSENNEKRQSCVTLCVNQCKASYDLSYAQNYNKVNGNGNGGTVVVVPPKPVLTNDTSSSNETTTSNQTTSTTDQNATQTGGSAVNSPSKDTSVVNDTTSQSNQTQVNQTSETTNNTQSNNITTGAQQADNTTQQQSTTNQTQASNETQTSSDNQTVAVTTTENSTQTQTIDNKTTIASDNTTTASSTDSQTNNNATSTAANDTTANNQTQSQNTAAQDTPQDPSPLVLALFENPETCNPTCIAQCGKLSLQVTDQEMTSCFKSDCGCSVQSKEYEQINNTAMSNIPMAKNFYNYYLADQRASSLMEFQAGLISASQNMDYVTQMRNLNQQQSTHEDQLNLAEFSTYQIFIIVFFIIVSSIALGTSVFFVKRHFFECEEGDKLLRQKYMRYHEQMEKSIYGRNASQSDAKYHKLQRN
eukprot:403370992